MLHELQLLFEQSDLLEAGQILLLIIGSFISEDVTILASSLLVASGQKAAYVFFLGNFLGITIGDILLYATGRGLVKHKAIRKAKGLNKFQKFLNKNKAVGFVLIFLARAIPGTRIPVYVSAGIGRYPFDLFFVATITSVALWVSLFYLYSEKIYNVIMMNSLGIWTTLAVGLALYILIHKLGQLLPFLFDPYKRKSLPSFFLKMKYYEFWPSWLFYLPVVFYYIYLSLRYRNPLLPSAVNPSIFSGGLIGESKHEIYKQLQSKDDAFLKYTFLPADLAAKEKTRAAKNFMTTKKLTYPIIIKPDSGLRGQGVVLAKNKASLEKAIKNAPYPLIVQELSPYPHEVGLFYIKQPESCEIIIYSITEKVFPTVTGDGKSTLGQLILADKRARLISHIYLDRFEESLDTIPAKGEVLKLVNSGSHAQGSIFKDGRHIESPALTVAIDKLVSQLPNFYVGRLDLRFKDLESFRQGKNFKLIEINGAGAEATHIYDEKLTLGNAYKVLFKQWKIMFEIGAINRARGLKPTPVFRFMKELIAYKKFAKNYATAS